VRSTAAPGTLCEVSTPALSVLCDFEAAALIGAQLTSETMEAQGLRATKPALLNSAALVKMVGRAARVSRAADTPPPQTLRCRR
jgi:hypothetical protein